MSRKLIDYPNTPQVTGLEYEEIRDLELHPEKSGEYKNLVKRRTEFGKEFVTKEQNKKKRRKSA